MLKPKRDAGSSDLAVVEMRRSLAQRIRELAPKPGEHLTPILDCRSITGPVQPLASGLLMSQV